MQSNSSRFVGSLKKQFAEQEAESLSQRTSMGSTGRAATVECLVSPCMPSCLHHRILLSHLNLALTSPGSPGACHIELMVPVYYPNPTASSVQKAGTCQHMSKGGEHQSVQASCNQCMPRRDLWHDDMAAYYARECFSWQVAVSTEDGQVLACIDTRLPRSVCGTHPTVGSYLMIRLAAYRDVHDIWNWIGSIP